MSADDYRPRITAELTEQQMAIITRIIPHGMKKPLFQALIDGIIEVHKRGGHEAIAAIVSRYISIQQLSDIGIERTKNEKIAELKYQLYKLEGKVDGHDR